MFYLDNVSLKVLYLKVNEFNRARLTDIHFNIMSGSVYFFQTEEDLKAKSFLLRLYTTFCLSV